jgi:hypothetical protein
MFTAASFAAIPAIAGIKNKERGNDKIPPLTPEMVFEFVRVAHGNLERTKEMFEKEPMLINASWDWGGGDFETALGGPSHVGNRDLVNYLLDKGARIDIFCAAMLGENGVVSSLIKRNSAIVNAKGPHQLSFLYHIAISGDVNMAAIAKPHITNLSGDANQALHSSVRSGHAIMTEWLLKNGVDDPNTKDFAGNTPLQNAEKKGLKEIAKLLKEYKAM